jgi:DNA-binding MarR family transcriptional regulator
VNESKTELIDEAVAQIEALMSYRRRAFCDQPLTREVSLPQLHVLMRLQESGPTMVSELAHALGTSIPSASSIVDRMEEHGLVDRVRNEIDRRVVHVAISERGQAVVEEFGGPKRVQLQRLLSTMSTDELHDVIRGAEAVYNGLERLRATPVAPKENEQHPYVPGYSS